MTDLVKIVEDAFRLGQNVSDHKTLADDFIEVERAREDRLIEKAYKKGYLDGLDRAIELIKGGK